MSKVFSNRTAMFSILCAVLSAALVLCQFVPFWTVPETGERLSIGHYVGFPQEHAELEAYLETIYEGEYNINQVVLAPVAIMALCTIGTIVCLFKSGTSLFTLIPAAGALVGVWGYLTKAVLQAGTGWWLHLLLCIAVIAASACSIVSQFRSKE